MTNLITFFDFCIFSLQFGGTIFFSSGTGRCGAEMGKENDVYWSKSAEMLIQFVAMHVDSLIKNPILILQF